MEKRLRHYSHSTDPAVPELKILVEKLYQYFFQLNTLPH